MQNQANNPTHGVTLEKMLNQLQAHYGWEGLAERIDIRCFRIDPSVKSSLVFLRRTPWARARVEALYVEMTSRPADTRPRLFGKKPAG
ncbi:VF530 family protein [Chromobacterium paludis]|uniref:DUF2132 domain-containing protein n=1 Tax=Chromobacterium paludis TaxID=2605945 RepID=A0A5C1DKJ9_9NEIS|nr:VF530 family protein [Chromobacterium paludis]QEL57140.1 DUF2132 domain-containing protein [Chromobacterium paludis]